MCEYDHCRKISLPIVAMWLQIFYWCLDHFDSTFFSLKILKTKFEIVSKRPRKSNFLPADCATILQLAEENLSVTRDKFTNVLTNQKNSWDLEKIVNQVNSLCEIFWYLAGERLVIFSFLHLEFFYINQWWLTIIPLIMVFVINFIWI